MIENSGLEMTNAVISGFSTQKTKDSEPLNPDIENFLKKNAIQFSREKKSITYLVMDEDNGFLLGFFSLAHKPIKIPPVGMSKTKIRTIEKYARI